jgi:hypothetical protein
MSRSAKIFLVVVLLAGLTAAGFYLRILVRRAFIQPPQHGEAVARTRLSEAALEPKAAPSAIITLYFPAYEQGGLLEETREISWAETEPDRIRQVLLALLEGSHQGYSRPLPPATDIRAVFLAPDGTVLLDLSNQALTEFSPGIESEVLAVYSIVNSLAANIRSVKRVKILVQGQEVDTLDGHVDLSGYFVPTASPLAAAP